MDSITRFLIRASAFIRKEIVEILRQPRLVLTLVLGPFLILFLFGIGFSNEPRALRTLFVVEEGSPLAQQIQDYATSLGPQLIFSGVTGDEQAAMRRLRSGQVDVVAVAPPDAFEQIRDNQQAVFTLYHNEIDPFQVDYVTYFGQVYVSEVNRRVLLTITQESQAEASTLQDEIAAARASAAALRAALEQGNAPAAREEQETLDRSLTAVELGVGATLGLLSGVQDTVGGGQADDLEAIQAELAGMREETDAMSTIDEEDTDFEAEAGRAARIEEGLATLETRLGEFQRVDPAVLVSPFGSQPQGVATVQPKLADYFAPSVIVLLLQHLAITLASLSFVRERQLGTLELFRVAPLSSAETLLGKYLSYLLFGGILAVILTALLIWILQVPMLGSWLLYSAVVGALLLTSLGIGFVISLIAQTDSQAVQYAMIILLASVFFSGFFLSLETLWAPVRTISWLLPATYGIQLLQNIMLRGYLARPLLLSNLAIFGVILFVIAQFLLRRSMART